VLFVSSFAPPPPRSPALAFSSGIFSLIHIHPDLPRWFNGTFDVIKTQFYWRRQLGATIREAILQCANYGLCHLRQGTQPLWIYLLICKVGSIGWWAIHVNMTYIGTWTCLWQWLSNYSYGVSLLFSASRRASR
jgi:hypothetical protein